jgi:phenylpropionate dioxygenase-like ring-hydroxylating dioxygenase large terminal subunit
MNKAESAIDSYLTGRNGVSRRNWPLNCWWVAATAGEVSTKPISRWVLEQRVVLFRTEQGAPAALEDRCAHRWAPLSQGKLIGNDIACPYHGFRYNTRGQCTLVPSQSHIPKALKVRSYPVREHGSYVWLWMGDPAKADPALLPNIPWFSDPAWVQVRGYTEMKCNYLAIQENLLDMTHAAHLHASAWQQFEFEVKDWQFKPLDIKVADCSLTMVLTDSSEATLTPFEAKLMGLDVGKAIRRSDIVTFASPACNFAENNVTDSAATSGERSRYIHRGMHCITPISADYCHYWWANAMDYGHEIPNAADEMIAFLTYGYNQDKEMLEAIQATRERDMRGDDVPEISVAADRAPMLARGIVKKMLDAEAV